MPVIKHESDSLSHTLIALDRGVDPLWLRHLPRTRDAIGDPETCSDRILSFGAFSHSHYPHPHNVFGWCRWLQQNDIQAVRCYLPGRKSWALLSAAVLGSIPISLYVTQWLERGDLGYLKLWKKRTHRFFCPANSIRRQLQAHGVPTDAIWVEAPKIQFSPAREVELADSKKQLQIQDNNFTILSLVPPHKPKALKDIVWTAAIVEHACPGVRLILSGESSPHDRSRLRDWEKMFKTENMVIFNTSSRGWDRGLMICDVVLAGDTNGKEAIRLLYARAAEKPVIAAGTCHHAFLTGYEKAILVDPPTPRQFAATILDRMQKYSHR
jgi:hypothetical protein